MENIFTFAANQLSSIMEVYIQLPVNRKLFIRDPESTDLGRRMLAESIRFIHQYGFEEFTFKKLASSIGTTEATIYRYFENKHRLLIYIVDWYWSWLHYLCIEKTRKTSDPAQRIRKIIRILTNGEAEGVSFRHIDKNLLKGIVISEGSKAWLTRHVVQDNRDKLFKPYKDLCGFVAGIFLEYRPRYRYSRSLATTVVKMSHTLNFYTMNLPSLTDYGTSKDTRRIRPFLEDLVLSTLKNH